MVAGGTLSTASTVSYVRGFEATTGNAAADTLAGLISTTAGDCLVAIWNGSDVGGGGLSPLPTLFDGHNTWILATASKSLTGGYVQAIWVAPNAKAVNSVRVNTDSLAYMDLVVWEFSGVATVIATDITGNARNVASPATATFGPFAVTGEYFIGTIQNEGGGGTTATIAVTAPAGTATTGTHAHNWTNGGFQYNYSSLSSRKGLAATTAITYSGNLAVTGGGFVSEWNESYISLLPVTSGPVADVFTSVPSRVPYVSVPLYVTGLASTTYHVVISPIGSVANQGNVTQVALSISPPAIAANTIDDAGNVVALTDYVPLYVYGQGKSAKPVHSLASIRNTQPDEYNTITYDYWGKPVQYMEYVGTLVNLIPPNTSSFGGVVAGTTAGWTGSNAALAVVNNSGGHPPLGDGATLNASPLYPTLNAQEMQYVMRLTASSAADMSAETATGTNGIPVTVGVEYTAFAWFEALTAGRACSVGIQWYTAAGASISSAFGSTVNDVTTGWVQPVYRAVAPATAAFAAVIVKVAAPGNGEQHYVEAVSLAISNENDTAYFPPQCGPGGVRSVLTLTYNIDGTLAQVS